MSRSLRIPQDEDEPTPPECHSEITQQMSRRTPSDADVARNSPSEDDSRGVTGANLPPASNRPSPSREPHREDNPPTTAVLATVSTSQSRLATISTSQSRLATISTSQSRLTTISTSQSRLTTITTTRRDTSDGTSPETRSRDGQHPLASAGHARGVSTPSTSSSDSSGVATSTRLQLSLGPGDLPQADSSHEGKTNEPHAQRLERTISVQPPSEFRTRLDAGFAMTGATRDDDDAEIVSGYERGVEWVPTLHSADETHHDARSGGALSPFVPTPPGEDKGRSYPSEESHTNPSASLHVPGHATSVAADSLSRPLSTPPLNQPSAPASSSPFLAAPVIAETLSISARRPRGKVASEPHRDSRSGEAPSESAPSPDKNEERAYPSERIHTSLLASSLEQEYTGSAAYPPSSFPPASGPPSLYKSSSRLQENEGVIGRGLKRAAEGQTSDKEDERTTASQYPESHKGGSVTDSYGAGGRKPEPNPSSSNAPDPKPYPKTTPQSSIEPMYSSGPSHVHDTGSTPSELGGRVGRPSDSVPLGRTEGLSTSPPPPGPILPLKSTRSLRQQEGRGAVSSSEQNRAGPMMMEIPSSLGISFNPKHSAPPLPSYAQASPGPSISRDETLSLPVTGAGTPSEGRDGPTRPSVSAALNNPPNLVDKVRTQPAIGPMAPKLPHPPDGRRHTDITSEPRSPGTSSAAAMVKPPSQDNSQSVVAHRSEPNQSSKFGQGHGDISYDPVSNISRSDLSKPPPPPSRGASRPNSPVSPPGRIQSMQPEDPTEVDEQVPTCCVCSIAKTLLCCCTATTGVDKRGSAHRVKDLLGVITTIDDTIKSLRESIPYIGPVVDVLIDVVKALDAVLSDKRCQNFIKYSNRVLDMIDRVADPVFHFVKKCKEQALTAINLPRALESIFKSFKKELDTVMNAFKHMGLLEAICFVAWYTVRKAKKSAENILKLLERFQSVLAFDPRLLEVAGRITSTFSDVKARFDNDQTPLHVVSQLGRVDLMRDLIKRSAERDAENKYKETPLYLAVRSGFKEVTDELLRHQVNVNHRDVMGRTPLQEASEKGHDAVVSALIEGQARCNDQDNYHWAALHMASRTGNSNVVRVLLDQGADVDIRDDLGWTALHMASHKGRRDVVQQLLSKGADVNAREYARRETALHLAAYYGHHEVAELLISHGNVDQTIRNSDGETPLSLARIRGHQNIEMLLGGGD